MDADQRGIIAQVIFLIISLFGRGKKKERKGTAADIMPLVSKWYSRWFFEGFREKMDALSETDPEIAEFRADIDKGFSALRSLF